MSTPLVSTDRIEMKYVFSGLTHRVRQYVALDGSPGPGALLAKRGGGAGLLWTDCAQFEWDSVRTVLSSTVTAGSFELQHLDGVSWNTVDAYTATGAGPSSSAQLTQQTSIVLRDQLFQFVRLNLYETDQPFTGHDVNGSAQNAAIAAIVADWVSDTDDFAPYNWVRGRSGLLIANSGGAVGVTQGQNYAIKRQRGLA
jgi:hypothetical protein